MKKISNLSDVHFSTFSDQNGQMIMSNYDNDTVKINKNGTVVKFRKPYPIGLIDYYPNGFILSYIGNQSIVVKIYQPNELREKNCNITNGTLNGNESTVVCINRSIKNVYLSDSYFECVNCQIDNITAKESKILLYNSKINHFTADRVALSGIFRPIDEVKVLSFFNCLLIKV